MSARGGSTIDHEAWAEASREHGDEDAAHDALMAFYEEIDVARKKHGVASLVLVSMQMVDGRDPLAAWYARGDPDAWETLAAVGMRQARKTTQERMAEIAGLTSRTDRPPPVQDDAGLCPKCLLADCSPECIAAEEERDDADALPEPRKFA